MRHRFSNLKHRLIGRSDRAESGAVLILMAGMITVLLGMTAFAVDFGWLYWNGTKIQHGADAAALAGVIYEPDASSLAKQTAVEVAKVNGYTTTRAVPLSRRWTTPPPTRVRFPMPTSSV